MFHSEYPVTTGCAADETWNISESTKVQERLADIIDDYLRSPERTESPSQTVGTSTFPHEMAGKLIMPPPPKLVPRYIRELFRHYCERQLAPKVEGMEGLYDEMSPKLRVYFFEVNAETPRGDAGTPRGPSISRGKVGRLFPNAENTDIGPVPLPEHMDQGRSISGVVKKVSSKLTLPGLALSRSDT